MDQRNCPVFVTGPSNSGKTLMSLLLASQPSLAIPRYETHFWDGFYCRYGELIRPANLERCIEAMVSDVESQGFRHRPDWIRRRLSGEEPNYGRLFAAFMEDYAEQSSKSRWGCHAQELEDHAEAIFRYFPAARVIHMVRDPRDRYAAKYRRKLRDRRLPGRIGIETSLWLRSANRAARNRERFPGAWKVVSYEELILRPEETLAGVLAFVGETMIPLSVALEALPKERDHMGRHPYGPLSRDGVGCYRRLLTTSDVAFIQGHAGRGMSRHGYDTDPVRLSAADRLALCGAAAAGFMRIVLNRARRAWMGARLSRRGG